MCHTDNCLCYVVLCVLVTCLVMSFIAFPMGIPSIEAEEAAASSLSEKMTSVLLCQLLCYMFYTTTSTFTFQKWKVCGTYKSSESGSLLRANKHHPIC